MTVRDDLNNGLGLSGGIGLRCATPATTAAFPLTGRAFRVFLRARCLAGMAGKIMRSGLSGVAGLPATLALAAPGLLAILAPCRRRPVKLRPCAAFGVFHVRFPSRRASPEGMQQALIRFLRWRENISHRRNHQILFDSGF